MAKESRMWCISLIIPGYSGRRRKSHAHGAIVAATTPNLAAALSARHINTYVYVDKWPDNERVYIMMRS